MQKWIRKPQERQQVSSGDADGWTCCLSISRCCKQTCKMQSSFSVTQACLTCVAELCPGAVEVADECAQTAEAGKER